MKRYYLWTIGCQMNDADAARVSRGLAEMGFLPTREPKEADLVVLITCVVRQSAEDRVVGRLTSLKHLASRRPGAILTVMGCFIDNESALREAYPWVDAFFKPSATKALLSFVRQRVPVEDYVISDTTTHPSQQIICAYVPISYGCAHHCTYCIVRLRRGKQQSRPLPQIVQEVRHLADADVREVTLLGQNVDAYGQDLGPGAPDLAAVLEAVHRLEGLWRIRFLTSHPSDMTQRLIHTVARLPRVCPHFELAVQSGDDQVLRRMGRTYTVADFEGLVATIRDLIPECSIATDVIVGFPGETNAQFRNTYDLMTSARFNVVHIAKYSPRPGTPAAQLRDDVPSEEKERRRSLLDQLQERISGEINGRLVGRTVEVLVEDRHRGRWRGRTVTNKLVFFEDTSDWRGRLARVQISSAGPWSLRGKVVSRTPQPDP